jgi:hypothetical protein
MPLLLANIFRIRLSYNHVARTPQKTLCIVDKAYLPRRCLAIGVLLVRAFASAGTCLATRCLEMGMARTTQETFLSTSFLLFCACIAGVA